MTTLHVDRASDLGPALRAARLSQDVTQSALADLAHVGRQWLNAFEAGDKPSAPLDMVWRLITVLGVSMTLAGTSPPAVTIGPAVDDELIDLDVLVDGDGA